MRVALSPLKGQQNFCADRSRTLNGLEPWCDTGPLRMPEVRVGRTRGQNKIVVLKMPSAVPFQEFRANVDARRFGRDYMYVFLIRRDL
jgi:hypothetical protein